MELFDTFIDHIDFYILAYNKTLTADIILKYWFKFENSGAIYILAKHPCITPNFIDAHPELEFLKFNIRSLAWNSNFNHHNLPNINWSDYSFNPNLTLDSMIANIAKLNWGNLGCNPNITWAFIYGYRDRAWDWAVLSSHEVVTMAIVEANPTIARDYCQLSYNPNLTWTFIQANITENWQWSVLSSRKVITWTIILANPALAWDWNNVSLNPSLKFIEF